MMKALQELKNRILRKGFLIPFTGAVIGTAGGFMYYYFIGCRNGSCAIVSNPWLSMLWGAAVGYLLADLFTGKRKADPEKAGSLRK